ncbi:GntR family transcriptional regulator [Kitasatospora sp. MAP12-15]|uniref:GntR family transcriptional regulator n=1 Tax=unclassified Kitasatospora TaxID=2633591 RepID=UPI002473D9BE|nr:GntR family transcriptional regulator [Kitasatospora sp. MAP12-44]MDH6111539.1 GntR family transcriptional regulator [Kitasatospora sp. MAP12-44]
MAKVYERIADDLRRLIRAGELAPGDRLPAETSLVDQYGKSLPTVRQALALLQSEGLIEKKHGRGNFVREARKLVQRTNDRHQWEKDRARSSLHERQQTGATERDTGLELDDLVFTAEYREISADAAWAAAFGVSEGTILLERVFRTRYRAESAPFNLTHSYLVRDMIAGNPDLLDAAREPWPGGTQNQLFTVGIEVDRVEERVTARPPTAEETEELELPPGTSVLVLRKSTYDINDRVVDIADVTLPGDRTEMTFTTRLERW